MFTTKRLLNVLMVIVLLGFPTVSFSMESEEVDDISKYGIIGWKGYVPPPYQRKQSIPKSDWPELVKRSLPSYKLNEKWGLASFELPYKGKTKDPEVSVWETSVVLTFASEDSSEPKLEKPRSKKQHSAKGVKIKSDKVEIKLDSSSDSEGEVNQQKGKSKQGKTVNSVVAKRKKIPDSTHASKKSAPKRQKIAVPKGKRRGAEYEQIPAAAADTPKNKSRSIVYKH